MLDAIIWPLRPLILFSQMKGTGYVVVVQNKSMNYVYSFSEEIFVTDNFSHFCSVRDEGVYNVMYIILEVVARKKVY